eukprot:4747270-Prymnesium_polylepis.1
MPDISAQLVEGEVRVEALFTQNGAGGVTDTRTCGPIDFLVTGETHAPSCELRGAGSKWCVAGRRAEFVVVACDERGRKRCAGGDRINFKLHKEVLPDEPSPQTSPQAPSWDGSPAKKSRKETRQTHS